MFEMPRDTMKYFLILVIILQVFVAMSQVPDTLAKGRVVWNKPHFKHFAVIVQDTSMDSGNRSGTLKLLHYKDCIIRSICTQKDPEYPIKKQCIFADIPADLHPILGKKRCFLSDNFGIPEHMHPCVIFR